MRSLFDRMAGGWHRRYFRPDPAAVAAFAGLTPVVVVTGASAGIGLAFARRFARAGHSVLMVARDAARLEAAAGDVRAAATAGVAILVLDVTAADAPTRLDAALAHNRGYADILVNNAGVGQAGAFADCPPATLAQLIATNIDAPSRLCRHVLPGQLLRGRGGIINVGSIGGMVPGPFQAAYYASKAYLLSLSEALAAETLGRGIRICCVVPGPVETDFHARMGAATALYRRLLPGQTPDAVAAYGIAGFWLGARVVAPGILATLLMLAVRCLPHRLTVPFIRALLKP